jgi:hypothetical protein
MAVGLYPKNMSQEEWLRRNAQEIVFPDSYDKVPEDKMLIMWVDNPSFGAFTEIIRGESEYDYFARVLPQETRTFKCFIADKNLTIDNADSDLSFLKNKSSNNLVTKFKKFFK